MGIAFTKFEGCGNDFIIIQASAAMPGDLSSFGRQLCSRTTGIGADGLIVLRPGDADLAYQVSIINATGLPAEMCGNGARCVARYAVLNGLASPHHRFGTEAGVIEAQVADERVRISLTPPFGVCLGRQVEVGGRVWACDLVNTGVPHAVVWMDEIDGLDVPAIGASLRWHPAFQPAGVNANFVSQRDGELRIRTFERGVEAETRACGTGAGAAALIGHLRGRVGRRVNLHARGGLLTVDIAPPDNDGTSTDVSGYALHLEGPAYLVYAGEIASEWFPHNLP